MDNITLSKTITVTDEVLLLPIISDVYAYKHTKTIKEKGKRNKKQVFQGIAFQKEIERFASGKADLIEDETNLHVVHKDYIEKWRIYGDPRSSELDDEEGCWTYKEERSLISEEPYDDLQKEDYICVEILRYSEQLKYINGKFVPKAINFSYTWGNTDNAHYDLHKLVEILSDKPNIRFEHRSRDRQPDEKIKKIEYYNSSDHRNKYVAFTWVPTEEEYNIVQTQSAKYDKRFPSSHQHEAIFDLDLLGLRAGGAALYTDYYKSKEYEG